MTWFFLSDVDALILSIRLGGRGRLLLRCVTLRDGDGDRCVSGRVYLNLSFNMPFFFLFCARCCFFKSPSSLFF